MAKAAGRAESAAGKPAIAQGDAELLIFEGIGVGLGNLQKGVATAEGERSDIVVDEKSALVHTSQLEVIVEVPFRIGAAAGGSPQPGYDRRKMARLRGECDAGQVFRGGKHVALSGDECAAESRIEKIFLLHFPGDNFFCFRPGSAGLDVQAADALPRYDLFGRGSTYREVRHGRIALLNV